MYLAKRMLGYWIPRRRITGTGMWWPWPHPVGSAKDQNLLLGANRLPVQNRFLACCWQLLQEKKMATPTVCGKP
jgi:hypothetical protein